jgi:dUTP pyrophosphatase
MSSAVNTYISTGVLPPEGRYDKSYVIPALKLDPKAKLPQRAHPTDAGADLFSCETLTLSPGESALVNTGIAVKIPRNYGGFILNRSSQRVNGITSLGTGLIDTDYRGPLKVFLVNEGANEYKIIAGETKIAQLVIMPVMLCDFQDAWNDTERGSGGFGSTGK